ncbi:MAG TPA: erythromycin esterase family protein, partial [Rhizomicrobium sp.]
GESAIAQSRDTLQTWLEEHVSPVRAIDATDEDFRDLEPLGDAIGAARVVQLGEPSHGAGSCFAAKARIVKYLHQRRGFDVLIWESGLYDVALAQAGMRGTDDAMTAARRGVFTLWSMAAEVKPLFDYIKASQATARPLDIAGFDMQVTADGSTERFAEDLRAFADQLRESTLRERATALVDNALTMRKHLFNTKFAGQADLADLAVAVRELGGLINDRRADFEQVRGPLGTDFMAHAIQNMVADAAFRAEFARAPATTAARESSRDAANAVNLRWLLEKQYAGRKAVVWAHDVHVMNAYYDSNFRGVHLAAEPGDMKPTGTFIADWLGKQVYTIGMTTFQGEDGFAMGGPATPVPPAPDGSLEARLHAMGHPYAFMDLRTLDRRQSVSARLPKYDVNTVTDVSRIYGGIFYIDRMARATRAT